MFHQIGRCAAPCEDKISKQDYARIVQSALAALKNPQKMVPQLLERMARLAQSENFEEAAQIRDTIEILKQMNVKVEVDLAKLDDFEVFAIAARDGLVCAVHFSIREGKISASSSHIINCKAPSADDIANAYKQMILSAFPAAAPVACAKIYVYDEFDDADLIREILSKRHERAFKIYAPKIGEKRKICEIAYQNCEINIKKHLKTHDYAFLQELKDYFNLTNLPVNIEVFDNSHMFGAAAVGAMISFQDGEFNKQNYRHKHLSSNNDYDQMREYLTSRALKFDELAAPDLWLIDGGTALLNLAEEIICSVGANVDIIAISKEKIDAKAHRAKGAAKDKICTKGGIFSLPTDDKKLQFFQRLRDEAHRFAISFHQKSKRKLDLQSSKLLSLGVSKGSLKKLLDFYGDFESIYAASFDEIRSLTNIQTAEKILNNH